MKKLMILTEVLELARISYPTLTRWLEGNAFPQPVNGRGRGRKLLFDPDAVEAWIKKQQSQSIHTPATNPTKRRHGKMDHTRQEAVHAALERHRTTTTKKGCRND